MKKTHTTLALTDSRGVRLDAPFYPHTINCVRKSFGSNPKPCDCGGVDMLDKKKNPCGCV